MQQLKERLDLKLKNNDVALIPKILDFISETSEYTVDFCSECNCLDKVNWQNDKCDICTNKSKLATEYNHIIKSYEYGNGTLDGWRYKPFSDKLHEYVDNKIYNEMWKHCDNCNESYCNYSEYENSSCPNCPEIESESSDE